MEEVVPRCQWIHHLILLHTNKTNSDTEDLNSNPSVIITRKFITLLDSLQAPAPMMHRHQSYHGLLLVASLSVASELASVKMTSLPYSCDLEISFPTAIQAETVMKVLQVDRELDDRVSKTFALKSPGGNTTTKDLVVLLV